MARIFIIIVLFTISVNQMYPLQKEATISFDIHQTFEEKPSNKLFGLFVEFLSDYINGPGGMWAQEFADRGFDLPFCKGANIGCVWHDTLSAGNPESQNWIGGYNPNGRFYKKLISYFDDGFNGVYQEISYSDTVTHELYVYYRGTVNKGSAKIIIFDKDKTQRLIEFELPEPPEKWTKYTVQIPILPGHSKINVCFAIEGRGKIDFDEVSCIPDNNIMGVRNEWYQYIKNFNAGLFRYPGGCFADLPNADFLYGIGPIDHRESPNLTGMAEYQRMDFGTDEFLQFCEFMGIEPHITLNFEKGTPEKALEWIRYVNSDTNDYWGKLRKQNGRAEPYNVKYFEIGNEQWYFPIEYAHGYLDFYDLIKEYDSSLVLIIDGNNWSGDAYFDTLYNVVDYKMDVYGYHPVLTIIKEDENDPMDAARFLIGASSWDNLFADQQESIDKRGLTGRTTHAITEWWTFWGSWSDWVLDTNHLNSSWAMGLANGGIGLSFIKNAFTLQFAERSTGLGLIRRSKEPATGKKLLYPMPSYYALSMLSRHLGEELIHTTIETDTYSFIPEQSSLGGFKDILIIDAAVTKSKDSLFIAIINRSEIDVYNIQFNINHQFTNGKLYQIVSDDLLNCNTAYDPFNIIDTEQDIKFNKIMQFPPLSLSVLALPFNFKDDIDYRVNAYPNPTTDIVKLPLSNFDCEDLSITLYNVSAKEVYSQDYELSSKHISFSTALLSKGIYHGIAKCGKRIIKFSFVKH